MTTRRAMLAGLLPALPLLADNPFACPEDRALPGWCMTEFKGKRVYSRGTGPTIVLLHELNGLSPGCVDFGTELAAKGFRVYMPKFFGHAVQDSPGLGYLEAALSGFSFCSKAHDSSAGTWLRPFVDDLCQRPLVGRGIGVIGMCLTGAFPLEVMDRPKVQAVVMSQPALPFGHGKQQSVGVSDQTLEAARKSGTPILAFRFKEDTLCTAERFRYLKCRFENQFDGQEFDAPCGFHSDWTHRAHAVLTGQLADAKALARKKVIEQMEARLR